MQAYWLVMTSNVAMKWSGVPGCDCCPTRGVGGRCWAPLKAGRWRAGVEGVASGWYKGRMGVRPMILAGMVYAVTPTAAVIMGDSLMYVVLPVVAGGVWGGRAFRACRVVLDRAWAQPMTCSPITHAMRRVSTRATCPWPPGPVLAALRPKHLSTLAEGQIGGNRDGAR